MRALEPISSIPTVKKRVFLESTQRKGVSMVGRGCCKNHKSEFRKTIQNRKSAKKPKNSENCAQQVPRLNSNLWLNISWTLSLRFFIQSDFTHRPFQRQKCILPAHANLIDSNFKNSTVRVLAISNSQSKTV